MSNDPAWKKESFGLTPIYGGIAHCLMGSFRGTSLVSVLFDFAANCFANVPNGHTHYMLTKHHGTKALLSQHSSFFLLYWCQSRLTFEDRDSLRDKSIKSLCVLIGLFIVNLTFVLQLLSIHTSMLHLLCPLAGLQGQLEPIPEVAHTADKLPAPGRTNMLLQAAIHT